MSENKNTLSPVEAATLTEDSQNDRQLVSFVLGKERFGVDILMVQEIITVPEITRIPNAPSFVEGVINLRGRLVPVIDLRKRLNVGSNTFERNTRIIVIQIGGKVTGLVVDAVESVTRVSQDSIETAPEIVTVGVESQYITGVSKQADQMIILLDFNKLLSKEDILKLHNLGENDPEQE